MSKHECESTSAVVVLATRLHRYGMNWLRALGQFLSPPKPMGEKHWKEQYEDDADRELAQLSALPVDELRRRVRDRNFGTSKVIWSAIASKHRESPSVGWLLLDFVKSDAEYLDRYACARALLTLLGTTNYEAADLTVAHRNPAAALVDVETMVAKMAGPRT